jgi:hypothetical protein
MLKQLSAREMVVNSMEGTSESMKLSPKVVREADLPVGEESSTMPLVAMEVAHSMMIIEVVVVVAAEEVDTVMIRSAKEAEVEEEEEVTVMMTIREAEAVMMVDIAVVAADAIEYYFRSGYGFNIAIALSWTTHVALSRLLCPLRQQKWS